MCVDPITIFAIASTASAAVGAYSSIQHGNAQYKAGMYNAQIAERNAQAVETEKANVSDAAAIERRRLGIRVQAEKGEQVAAASAMGIDPGFGTAADLVGDIQKSYMIDRSIIGKNELTQLGQLDKQQADYRDSASMSRAGAKDALKAGRIGAIGSLLDGASSVAGHWIRPGGSSGTPIARPVTATPLSPFAPGKLLPIGA